MALELQIMAEILNHLKGKGFISITNRILKASRISKE
jgi:hypothetical protein